MVEEQESVQETIHAQLRSDDSEVRAEYLKHFGREARTFSSAMAAAYRRWQDFDKTVRDNDKRAYVSALVFTGITLHILSMKLFLSGQAVASGNLLRQVIETIALALLCSGKELGVLGRLMDNNYSSKHTIRDVLRHRKRLGVNDGIETLRRAQEFYGNYSHPTLLTIAAGMSFSESGIFVGAAFDDGKLEAYRKEANGRVSLAETFPNFVEGVIANVEKW